MQGDLEKEKVVININTNFQEVFAEYEVNAEKLSTWLKRDLIRELAPKIYSAEMTEDPAAIIRRNWDTVIPKLYPGVLMSHRTALKGLRPEENDVYLTAAFTKNIELPGLTLHFKQGHPPLKDDHVYSEKLYVSQVARAYLENMQTHSGTEVNRTVPVKEVDERLDVTIRMYGIEELINVRHKAEELAHKLGMKREFEKLNSFITPLLAMEKPNALRDANKTEPSDVKSTRRFKRKLR